MSGWPRRQVGLSTHAEPVAGALADGEREHLEELRAELLPGRGAVRRHWRAEDAE